MTPEPPQALAATGLLPRGEPVRHRCRTARRPARSGFAAATGAGSADITPLRSLGNKALGLIVNVMYRTGWRYPDVSARPVS